MKVLLGIPCGSGFIPASTVLALMQLQKPPETAALIIERLRTDKARNEIVKAALGSGMEYVFFIDDDNPPPPDSLKKMIAHDKDIVTCPILQRDGENKICLFRKEIITEEKGKGIAFYHHLKKLDSSKGNLIKVDASGMGCVLIKRKVLEVLYKKYEGMPFEFSDITKNGQRRTMSEDVEFCERAVKEGFEIWADISIRPVHLGPAKQIIFTDSLLT